MNAEQTIDTAKSLQRVQNYLERLEVAKGYHKECIHAFIDKDGAEIPLLATDLKAILQQVAATNPTQQGLDAAVRELIDRLQDAQQDINLAANTHMSQQLASAAALLDEVESTLRALAATPAAGELATLQAGLQAAAPAVLPEPAAWLATFRPKGMLSSHSIAGANFEELKCSVPSDSVFKPLYTRHASQELAQFIEQVGDVHFQRCRVGSKEGAIRWDIEFGHYGDEVHGKTLREAITKAIAAQAKQAAAAPAVPQGWKLVPVNLLERIQESLGSFVSDQGWSQSDMDTADALDGVLARDLVEDTDPDDEAFDDFAEDVEDSECHNCSGTGEGLYDSQSCVVCLGKGFL